MSPTVTLTGHARYINSTRGRPSLVNNHLTISILVFWCVFLMSYKMQIFQAHHCGAFIRKQMLFSFDLFYVLTNTFSEGYSSNETKLLSSLENLSFLLFCFCFVLFFVSLFNQHQNSNFKEIKRQTYVLCYIISILISQPLLENSMCI